MLQFLLMFSSFFVYGKCGDLTVLKNSLIGIRNDSISIQFTLTLKDQSIVKVTVTTKRIILAVKISDDSPFQLPSKIGPYKNRVQSHEANNVYTLTINNLEYTDSGDYTIDILLKSQDNKYESHSSNISLLVKGGPDQEDVKSTCLIDEDSYGGLKAADLREKFSLTFEGYPLPNVTFDLFKNGYYENFRSYADVEQTNLNFYTALFTLSFFNGKVTRELNGLSVNFTAKGYKSTHGAFKLNVTWGPELQNKTLKNITVMEKEVTVFVAGNPPPQVSALFADKQVDVKNCGPCEKDVCPFCVDLEAVLNQRECGSLLTLQARGHNGREDNQNIPIYFPFTPTPASISSFVKQGNCLQLTMIPEVTGLCRLSYEYQLVDNNTQFHQGTTFNTTFNSHCDGYYANVTASVRARWSVGGKTTYSMWTSAVLKETLRKSPQINLTTSSTHLLIHIVIFGAMVVVMLVIICLVLLFKRNKRNKRIKTSESNSAMLNTNNSSNYDYVEDNLFRKNDIKTQSEADNYEYCQLIGRKKVNKSEELASGHYVDARRVLHLTGDLQDQFHVYYEPAFNVSPPIDVEYSKVDKSKTRKDINVADLYADVVKTRKIGGKDEKPKGKKNKKDEKKSSNYTDVEESEAVGYVSDTNISPPLEGDYQEIGRF